VERLLVVEGPFRFDLALRYLATSPSTVAELVDGRGYARAFRAATGAAVALVSAPHGGAAGALRLRVVGDGAGPSALEQAERIARDAFGLDLDAVGASSVVARDRAVAPLAERYRGLRPLAIPDPFEALCWAILGQQINVAFAARTKRALIERYGQPVELDGARLWLFPPPERLVELTPEELRPLQISRQKALYLAELARAVVGGQLDLDRVRTLPDETAIAALTRLKGVGTWTAEYLLLRGFGRPDALPAADVGLRAALGRLHGLGRHASETEVRAMAEAWRPYRGFVAFYLWFALQQREL
jgi:DNA-3-methyladenine glycosylase II